MQIHTFIVDSAAEAVGQVRAKLGPDAVVLNVRRLPVDGFSKLWKKIEAKRLLPHRLQHRQLNLN